MPWFKVDDKLWGHPKWVAVPARARGLWVTAGSWSAANGTDGRIPRESLRLLGATKADATALVNAGLWRELKSGWAFHEWSIYQPDAASERAKRKADSDAGTLGNHRRWHVKRSIVVPDCEYCQGMPPDPDEPPPEDEETYRPPDRVPDRAPDAFSIGSASPVPVPDTDKYSPRGGKSPKQREGDDNHPPQPCGRKHDPERNCRACADARRKAKDDEAEAARAKSARQRELEAADRARRQADDDAVTPATPEQIKQARKAAKEASE